MMIKPCAYCGEDHDLPRKYCCDPCQTAGRAMPRLYYMIAAGIPTEHLPADLLKLLIEQGRALVGLKMFAKVNGMPFPPHNFQGEIPPRICKWAARVEKKTSEERRRRRWIESYRRGASLSQVANQFGVAKSTISTALKARPDRALIKLDNALNAGRWDVAE